jgi:hypothetical protein
MSILYTIQDKYIFVSVADIEFLLLLFCEMDICSFHASSILQYIAKK